MNVILILVSIEVVMIAAALAIGWVYRRRARRHREAAERHRYYAEGHRRTREFYRGLGEYLDSRIETIRAIQARRRTP